MTEKTIILLTNLQIRLKFKTGQAVMVRNHICQTSDPRHLKDYRVFKKVNESTLLLVIPNGKVCKTTINDVKPHATFEPIGEA